MKVTDKITISPIHSIEWGEATWSSTDYSIRNRYDNAAGGKFNYAGSAEIPWENFKILILESIRRNHLNNVDLAAIMHEVSNKLKTL